MKMILIKAILVLSIPLFVNGKIYVFNTADGPSMELYDCILHDGLFYCRRPTEPMALNRSHDVMQCYHNGIRYSFAHLHKNNVSVTTVLHQWKSSIEKVDQYSRYRRNPSEPDEYVCHCTDPQSFGKNCEYRLPMGTTLAQTLASENSLKRYNPRYVQLYGDIICYITLKCNSGLLCLDWRDICDGIQQCMEGLDEENCDKLEFNECEDDEYRCMNGMCIPEEYFLDGEFDCLDWSDELQYYDDAECPIEAASVQCDDRICPPNQFSCGEGQCIIDRFEFQTLSQVKSECRSRREQYYLCETHYIRLMWTLPNGRCYEGEDHEETNRTTDGDCEYLLRCALSDGVEKHCPCGRNSSCSQQLHDTCLLDDIQYPKAGIMAPYVLFFYHRTRNVSSYGPDFIRINGTIKCQGFLFNISPPVQLPYISTLRQVENTVCQWARNVSTSNEYCLNQSLTFNNRPYSSSEICHQTQKCLSTYRIKDGFANCIDKMDEIDHSSISTICSKMQRYRFRCSAAEQACLSVTALGNVQNDCQNTFDEHWLGTSTQLADIGCNKLWKNQCEILRHYIENSWISNGTNQAVKQFQIPFRHYCDTFWNFALKEDENVTECRNWWICPEDQWQCETRQCIDEKWVFDGEWDCFDGSDEQVLPFSTLQNWSNKTDRLIAFSSFCNLTTEFPCLRSDVSNPLNNLTDNRPCISRQRLGDGHIDCYGAIDERNTLTHCTQPSMLGYNYKCMSSNDCIPHWNHCLGDRCPKSIDDKFWCDRRQNRLDCADFSDSICFNGTCVKEGRCDRVADCFYGEDEYMCEYQPVSKLTGVPYRKGKESTAKNTEHKIRLSRFPMNSNVTLPTADSSSTGSTTLTASPNQDAAPVAYWCNRGVGIEMHNSSIVCFCPSQYYGEKCQFHADRITVRLHLDLSQSIYTPDSDIKIVLKIVVLLLRQDEIIANYIFHGRAVTELLLYTKKFSHFLYARSFRHNQSNAINNHPYAVRIEMYERTNFDEPLLIAVWQYRIYFDNLPIFLLAKVLRLTQLNLKQNPCSNNPCHPNENCLPLMNDQSKYICLCKNHFTGENCSIKDQQCANGYCFPGAICKANYRGVLAGNQRPFCICPFDYFGERCHIRHDQCLLTPCHNNGTCYPASRPDSITCICTEQYRGKRCEFSKPEMKLHINESVHHLAGVVQYFDIDFITLNLILVHQQVYRSLPILLEYRHEQKTAPEIVLIKLYSSQIELPPELYLISVQINVTTIYATTQLTEHNQCLDIRRTFISDNETRVMGDSSPIRYHSLCRKNLNLFCFRDEFYLCICNENHSRVECFRYDFKLDQCSHCLAGGRCLKGDSIHKANNFICLCPPCHSGTNCQFNSNSFTFTLDQLFFTDLISNHRETTVCLLIIIPLLLFLVALPNNLFSIITFRRPNCLCNGIGQYLLYMSVINQLNLVLFTARLIHLAINITGLHSYPFVDHYLCKILNYLLISSSRMVYWLSSLVAIERVYMTLFLNGRWLRKPHIARRLIVLTLGSILISDIHELIFVKSLFGINDGQGGMCVIEFPVNSRSTWLLVHLIVSIMNSILPLLINIGCTMTISCVVAKKKINIQKTATMLDGKARQQEETLTNEPHRGNFRTHLHLLFEVLSENKELVIGPGLTLVPQLFSLPLFVISFTLYCQNLENSWVRYLLIASYFMSFIPQVTSFLLYILPSSFYSTEWHGTQISQWIFAFFRFSRPHPTTSKASGSME